ncbi:MAG: hypothetical protein KKC19_04270 [Nanoarchaeota archaeon]|nr:hypothetical protein [Nanoarchaeota archaeon]
MKKHSRRAFLKSVARVGAGTSLWAGLGYLTGKTFDYAVKPTVDSVLEVSDKMNAVSDTLSAWNPFKSKTKEKEQKPVSRRGFFSSLARMAYNNPVSSGTVAGATYGAGKYTLTGIPKYLSDKKIAILRDDNIDYRERLGILEEYKEKLEKGLGERDAKVEGLEKELHEVRRALNDLGGEDSQRKTFLIMGIMGLVISVGFSSKMFTGNAISDVANNNLFSPVIAGFIISLALIFAGTGRKS